MQRIAIVIFITLLVLVNAKQVYVSNTGDDKNGCGDIENPCGTIGYAVSQTQDLDIVIIEEGDYYLPTSIQVTSSIQIQSQNAGNTTIYCQGPVSSAFECNQSISFRGLSITNCTNSAIILKGMENEINSCEFYNNFGTQGGAIQIYHENVTNLSVENCVFQSNNASFGGAIIAESTNSNFTVLISDSIFSTNLATQMGGAIYADANLSVNNCSFASNQCNNGQGGAIYSVTNRNNAFNLIQGSYFYGNLAIGIGGAVYSTNFNTTIRETSCISNVARPTASNTNGGGAIYCRATHAEFILCNFTANELINPTFDQAISGAAALISFGSILIGETTIIGCRFQNNSVTGLFASPSASLNVQGKSITVESSVFSDHYLDGLPFAYTTQGGIARLLGNIQITITNTIFTNNYIHAQIAATSCQFFGFVINVGAALISIDSVVFTNNTFVGDVTLTSTELFGMLSSNDVIEFEMTNSLFYNNQIIIPVYNGPFLNIGGALSIIMDNVQSISLDNSTFSNNLILNVDSLTSLFFLQGAGVCIETYSAERTNITITGCTFAGNELKTESDIAPLSGFNLQNGAGLCILSNSTFVVIDNSTFTGNIQSYYGSSVIAAGAGAMFAGEILLIERSIFSNNQILVNNIICDNSIPRFAVGAAFEGRFLLYEMNSTIVENNAIALVCNTGIGRIAGGGCTMIQGVFGIIDNSQFLNNSINGTYGFGGGAYISFEHWIMNSIFRENVVIQPFLQMNSNTGGGALFLDGSLHYNFNISQSLFDANTGNNGGAIFTAYYSPNNHTFAGLSFTNNRAVIGGGIFVLASTNPPFDCSNFGHFENGSALHYGTNCAMEPWLLISNYQIGGSLQDFNFSVPITPSLSNENDPIIIYPGQTAPLYLYLIDGFLNDIVENYFMLLINVDHDQEYISNIPSDSLIISPLSDTGYDLSASYFIGAPQNHSVQYRIRNTRGDTFITRLTLVFVVTECPPGFDYSNATGKCSKCATNQYSWGDICLKCPNSDADSSSFAGCLLNNDSLLQQYLNETHQITQFEKSESASLVQSEEVKVTSIGPGVWPYPEFSNPSSLVACPNEQACIVINCITHFFSFNSTLVGGGGWVSNCTNRLNGAYCAEGYTGRLCSQCVCDASDTSVCYYESKLNCKKCSNEVIIPLYIAVIIFVMLTGLFFTFPKGALLVAASEIGLSIIFSFIGLQSWLGFLASTWMLLFLAIMSTNISGSHLKTFINFLQLSQILILPSFYPPWILPNGDSFFSSSSGGGFFSLPGLECLFPKFAENPAWKFIFTMLIPVFLIITIFAIICFIVFCKKLFSNLKKYWKKETIEVGGNYYKLSNYDDDGSDNESEFDFYDEDQRKIPEKPASLLESIFTTQTLKASLFIIYSGYLSLAGGVFTVLQPCTDGYMTAIPWIPCSFSDSIYSSFFIAAICFLVIYVIGVPVFFAFLLFYAKRQNRKTSVPIDDAASDTGSEQAPSEVLQHNNLTQAVEFLCEEYREEMYYYEMIWIVRRLLLAASVTLIPASSPWQYGFSASVIGISIFLQALCRPFTKTLDNFSEMASSLLLLIFFSVSWVLQVPTEDSILAFQETCTALLLATLFVLFFIIFLPFFTWIWMKLCKWREKI